MDGLEKTEAVGEEEANENLALGLIRFIGSHEKLEKRLLAIEDIFGGPPPEGLAATYDRAFARCQRDGCALYLRVIRTDSSPVCPFHGLDHGLELDPVGFSLEKGLAILDALNLKFTGDPEKVQEYRLELVERIRKVFRG